MKPAKSSINEATFNAGASCLDFANTVEWHASDSPHEQLQTYADLVAWALQTGILDNTSATKLLSEAAKRATRAQDVLKRAIALREMMYRIFVGIATGRSPRATDLEAFNIGLSKALGHLRVVRARDHYNWEWANGDADLDCILWPVLRSAADLLTSDKRTRIGQCADDRGCGWLFLDTSKNHSRRWCAMDDCGNRAKAQRHYQRRRQSRPTKTD